MPFAISCDIAARSIPKLKELRAKHLIYIRDHMEEILFGGPVRNASGISEAMIIVLKTDDRSSAERFIEHEPYNGSGVVFSRVLIRPWSQVIPQPHPNALDQAIREELSHGQ